MSRSRFRIYLIPCFFICFLTACSQAGGNLDQSKEQHVSETVGQERETTGGQETAQSAEEASSAEKTDKKEGLKIAEGYQFVRGLGIISPGSPVIYQMTGLHTPVIENEYGTAQLLSAFYQDGKVMVTVLYKDFSVYELSKEEAQQIQETERENRKKQERGEEVSWDSSYFCIDEEKQLYGRSAFMENLLKTDAKERKNPFEARMYIPGSTKPEYSFNQASYQTSYDSYLETGYVTRLVQFIKSDKYPETDGPEGIHELKLNYFEEPFVFEFEKGAEVASLQELKGFTERDGMWFYAEGEKKDGKLAVSCYFYSDEAYQIAALHAKDMTVYAEAQDGEQKELVSDFGLLGNWPKIRDTFTGVSNGSRKELVCALPVNADVRNVTVRYENPYVTDTSTILTSRIPIPEDEEELDIKAEFPDGILYLTKVSRVEELMKRGTDGEGNDILKPQIYLTGHVEDKRSDRHIHLILATDADSEEKYNGDPYRTEMYYSDNGPDGSDETIERSERIIQGFYIGYEEGMEAVTVRFHGAAFVWDTKIDVPVTLR